MDLQMKPLNFKRSYKGQINVQTGPFLETPSAYVSKLNAKHQVMVYTHKAAKIENAQVGKYLDGITQEYAILHVDLMGDQGRFIETELLKKTNQTQPPWIFVLGRHRSLRAFVASFYDGMIDSWLQDSDLTYNYDLIILGVRPEALVLARAAVYYGRRVLVWTSGPETSYPENLLNYLQERVNPNQIPKNRWKRAVQISHKVASKTSKEFFTVLKNLGVETFQGSVTFTNAHTIQREPPYSAVSGLNFIIACGKESLPSEDGLTETVEDLLKSHKAPDNAIVLGNSSIAVEVTTLLHRLGVPVTLMYPGKILKHYDHECVQMTMNYLVESGVRVVSCIVDEISSGDEDLKLIRGHHPETGDSICEEFTTVVNASEKQFKSDLLNIDAIELECDKKGSLVCNDQDQTSQRNIYAIGPIVHGRPNEALAAETASRFLIDRLYGMQETRMDYSFLPNMVRGIVEYGSIGMSEESAAEVYGKENVVVYKSSYDGFDHLLGQKPRENFVKLVCVKPEEIIVGMHVLGEHVEEKFFGFTFALRKKMTKAQLDATVGIDLSNLFQVTLMQ